MTIKPTYSPEEIDEVYKWILNDMHAEENPKMESMTDKLTPEEIQESLDCADSLNEPGDAYSFCEISLRRLATAYREAAAERDELRRERDAWELGFKMRYEGEKVSWMKRAEKAETSLAEYLLSKWNK